MAGFFEKFNTTIMDKLTSMGDVYQAQYATGIMSLMLGAVTLYILYVGYSTLAGKQQTPVPDLVWNLMVRKLNRIFQERLTMDRVDLDPRTTRA